LKHRSDGNFAASQGTDMFREVWNTGAAGFFNIQQACVST
jgi:hypothetical protein